MAPGTWTPTKRRGPIAAEFQTPGPAAIRLSSTFGSNVSYKTRSPAFTISGRNQVKAQSAGPGPGQYNINGLSYKAGKDDPHAPSMHVKIKDPKTFVTPSPGDYCPEKSYKVLEPSPKFSFGVKAEAGKEADIPAPNSYNIPDLIGTVRPGTHQAAPSFTMGGRFNPNEDKMKVPGPGSYNEAAVEQYKTQKSPAFSMGQRTVIPTDHTKKPGPGAHCPEKCMAEAGPKYTMSARLDDINKNFVPGPGHYESVDVNKCREKQPIFTMAPKTDLPKDKTPKPAPNAYCPEKYMNGEGPKYTMSPRLEEINKNKVPGPGTYEAIDVDKCRERQPIYTMAAKTELPTDKTPRPAPNAYMAEKCMQDNGPKFTMGSRIEDTNKNNVPGPGSYEAIDVEVCKERQPVYTMSPKTELPADKTPRPSPNAYHPEKCVTDQGPRFTMAPRLEVPMKNFVPGPGSYESVDVDKCKEKLPIFTMAPKTDLPKDKTIKPAPNAYSLEKCMQDTGPRYTMAPRPEDIDKNKVPGPGTYNVVEVEVCKERKPIYTMAPKTELISDKTPKPAPNAYNPEQCMKTRTPLTGSFGKSQRAAGLDENTPRKAPEFSFGIRHSQYLGQLRDQ